MAGIGKEFDSLRLNRFENERLVLALMISITAHLLAWSGYEFGKKFDVWERLHLGEKKVAPQAQPLVRNAEPEIFMDVSQASPDAPQNTKYYSDKNSRAASQEAGDSNVPKLNGTQTDFIKLENAPRLQISKAQSSSEEQLAKNENQSQSLQPGDWSLAKPEQKDIPTPLRPRTLQQARAQMQNHFPGVESRTEGGTHQTALVPAFDVKATPFGEYDAQVFEAIQQYWDNELDSQRFALDRVGRVTIQFRLNYDGSVTDMEILNNAVGELLGYVCQQAVSGAAPFAPWPGDMRREVGKNYRQITLTFIYY